MEILDLVNAQDQVIGQKYRSEVYKEKLKNFRVINAFLVNSKNEVWIPRRSGDKKLFPLCLDTSVGGHVSAGESYEEAFKRELQEELNIQSSLVPYSMVAHLTPETDNLSAFMHLYIIRTEESPAYNTDDFISAAWYSLSELETLIENGEKTKGDLPILVKTLKELL